jgi:hypothetical protein
MPYWQSERQLQSAESAAKTPMSSRLQLVDLVDLVDRVDLGESADTGGA